jgi:predicted nucleic acid-binding protein
LSKPPLLFDASSILTLVRELRGKAPDELLNGSTIPLAYYEIGNALWRECSLLKRISREDAEKLLRAMFAILQAMDIAFVENDEEATNILAHGCDLNITYYDSAYIEQASKTKKSLVTEDKKLAKAAERMGIKTFTSNSLDH